MNKLIAISSLVLGIGVAGWCGYQIGFVRSPAPVAKADGPALTKLVPGLSAGRADVDSAALRALIREEMTAVLARACTSLPTAASAGKAGASPAGSTPAQAAASPELQAQRREAAEQIDALVAQGIWGNEQRMSFHEKLATLDPQQREHAMEQFATAVNNGTLKVSTDGPPL
jgi:hypothetical protein